MTHSDTLFDGVLTNLTSLITPNQEAIFGSCDRSSPSRRAKGPYFENHGIFLNWMNVKKFVADGLLNFSVADDEVATMKYIGINFRRTINKQEEESTSHHHAADKSATSLWWKLTN